MQKAWTQEGWESSTKKKKRNFGDTKKKIVMVTWDNSDKYKSSSSNDDQAKIILMVDINKKVEVKTCSKSDTSSSLHRTMKKKCPMMIFFRTIIWFLFNAKSIKKHSKYYEVLVPLLAQDNRTHAMSLSRSTTTEWKSHIIC